MKRTILISLLCLLSIIAFGQQNNGQISQIQSGSYRILYPSQIIKIYFDHDTSNGLQYVVSETGLNENEKYEVASLIKQYEALMGTEDLALSFEGSAIDALSDIAVAINANVENIGARRLHTVLEKVMEDISFTASENAGKSETITAKYVQDKLSDLAQDTDLSKFIL